jgi:hypothetical protein
MIIDDDEIELAAQFQREADALLRDLLKAAAKRPPHVRQDDVPTYIRLLCSRWEAALEAEYRGEGRVMQDDVLTYIRLVCSRWEAAFGAEYRGEGCVRPGFDPRRDRERSTEQLVDDIFANAGDRIAVWRSEMEHERREFEAENARANLHIVGNEEDE